MTSNSPRRDVRGRFARRPVPDVDAESEFDPMGDDIPFDDISGTPSASTADRPRYGPADDELAQGGQGSRLRARRPEMVHPDDGEHTIYGRQGAVLRTAARASLGQWYDPTASLVGLDFHGSPVTGAPRVLDANEVELHGDHNPLSPGAGMLPQTGPRHRP